MTYTNDNGQPLAPHMIPVESPLKGRTDYQKHYDDYSGEMVISYHGLIIGRSGNDRTAGNIARQHAELETI